jgi:hypothetical protein
MPLIVVVPPILSVYFWTAAHEAATHEEHHQKRHTRGASASAPSNHDAAGTVTQHPTFIAVPDLLSSLHVVLVLAAGIARVRYCTL